MKKKCDLGKILASSLWFLLGAILFLIAGIRYIISQDVIGAIINFLVALLFLVGYIGRVKFNKKKK